MKKLSGSVLITLLLFLLCGCAIGDKATTLNFSFIYFLMALLSLSVLIGYCILMKKKDPYFLLLFVSIFTVNLGYYLLSASTTLAAALNYNRLSYLGSVFLPFSMLMIILKVAKANYKKQLPYILVAIAAVMFLVAATPGLLPIYYKTASIQTVNGVTVLDKTYGDLHCIYLFYLLFYFVAMISAVIHSIVKKKIDYKINAVFLTIAVFINIAVWIFGQIVKINFEFLSVSYVLSSLFILGLTLITQENEKLLEKATSDIQVILPTQSETVENTVQANEPTNAASLPSTDATELFKQGISELTKTERMLYDFYLEGKTTKEIMSELNIKENTLKYHNKNIYSKLGVSSRKQLVEIAKALETE